MSKLNQYQRAKLNKVLLIAAIILVVIAVGVGIAFLIISINNKPKPTGFEDTVVAKDMFEIMTIDLNTRKVLVDNKETTLQEEFQIPNEQAELIYSSTEEFKKYFADSTFEINIEQTKVTLKNPYQTKTLIVEADEIRDNYDAVEEISLENGLFILKYDTQKRAKAAYEYLKENGGIKSIEADEVSIIQPINDESQTVYGESETKEGENSHGVTAMGINNYKNIIKTNGSTADIVIATIGYGAAIDNTYFKGKISEDYYNFIDNSKDVHETIPQGSRTLEVIKESTSDNIKILPLVVINEDNYTTTASILQAITFATQKSNVICYEFVHKSNNMIKLALQNAFKENVPVCCVTKNVQEGEEMFPADDGTTIAVSSVDKDLKTTSYSAKGDFLDFVASSTDVNEIFNSASTVSKWSGAEYSNAHIASIIALVKSYYKDNTILEVYNFIRNFCQDLGEKGKDSTFGYGFPNFTKLKISDIDKVHPQLQDILVNNEIWEKSKKIQVKASDNIKIFGWNVTKKDEIPKEWKKSANVKNALDVPETLEDNGTYYIWIVDTAGNVTKKTAEVSKIDKVAPTIQYRIDDTNLEKEKYVTINASATDEQSGLHDLPYSWDKTNWGKENSILKVTTNGTYTLYVRDKLENIAERKIKINNLPQEGKADIDNGLIIKSITVSDKWEGNTNKEVTIVFNDNLDIKRRKITNSDSMPAEFRPNQGEENTSYSQSEVNETNTTSEKVVTTVEDNNLQGYTNVTVTVSLEVNKKYYIWVEDTLGNVISQGFSIKKSN